MLPLPPYIFMTLYLIGAKENENFTQVGYIWVLQSVSETGTVDFIRYGEWGILPN
jgi:hypothetical protein